MPYPNPHPPFPAPNNSAVDELSGATKDNLELYFHKGLEHDAAGRALPAKFETLRAALDNHSPALFQAIDLFGGRRLVNPQCGLAADRGTAEGWHFTLPKAPERDGKKETAAAEMLELYWMGLLRDVPFDQFATNANVAAAAAELAGVNLYADPSTANSPTYQTRPVTPQNIFRGGEWTPAGQPNPEHLGPYISQFLYHPIRYGTLILDQRERRRAADDYPAKGPHLIQFSKWLDAQNGVDTTAMPADLSNPGTYLHNMADLARWVHIDALYEAYLNAALILLAANAPLDPGNPYGKDCGMHGIGMPMGAGTCTFDKEEGFGTFGGPHILSLVCEVATRALKAVWYQKWVQNLRLRPEAYGGLVHRALFPGAPNAAEAKTALGTAPGSGFDVLNQSNTTGGAVARVRAANNGNGADTYLLPMVFPEGSPIHPAYGAGHATVAGACVTVLKAFFDESATLMSFGLTPQEPNPAAGYNALKDYTGADKNQLTVRSELDKVASNIAIGRNMAGVHWRSDYSQSVLLGQRVAVSLLYHQRRDYHERPWSFTFTSFGGKQVWIGYDPGTGKEGVYYDNGATAVLDQNDDQNTPSEAAKLAVIV